MNRDVRKIFQEGLGDARFESITWTDEDLILDLLVPLDMQDNYRTLRLRFMWVTALKIDMSFGTFHGRPLLFGAEVFSMERGGWRVAFEFGAAPDGAVVFNCNDIAIVPLPETVRPKGKSPSDA